MQLEMMRVLRRERMDMTYARLVLDRLDLISIDDGILRFAGAIEAHVKSLDAIHLATCSLHDNGVTMVTHAVNMTEVATRMGFDVHNPLDATA